LQVPGGATSADVEAEVLLRANFFVLARLPDDRQTRLVKDVEDWVITSDPFRRMRLVVTMFHELLPCGGRASARASGSCDRQPGEQPYLHKNTGHGDHAAFDINPTTLVLKQAAPLPGLRRMLSGFVNELVESQIEKTPSPKNVGSTAERPTMPLLAHLRVDIAHALVGDTPTALGPKAAQAIARIEEWGRAARQDKWNPNPPTSQLA
jgi:hypothetical protein